MGFVCRVKSRERPLGRFRIAPKYVRHKDSGSGEELAIIPHTFVEEMRTDEPWLIPPICAALGRRFQTGRRMAGFQAGIVWEDSA